MFVIGLTKSERWAMMGVIAIIALGMWVQDCRSTVATNPTGEAALAGPKGWNEIKLAGTPDDGSRAVVTAPIHIAVPVSSDSNRGPLNLNTATQSQLDALPGIGEEKSKAILEYRQSIGGFSTVAQLKDVSGIGEKLFERIQQRVYVEAGDSNATPSLAVASSTSASAAQPNGEQSQSVSEKTVALSTAPILININTASAEELEKIPGVGPKLAERIIARRNTAPFERPQDLIKVRGIGEKTFLKMRPYVTVK